MITMSISWDKQPLGQSTDQKIGETLNVPTRRVRYAREKRGIPAYSPRPILDWDALPLGEINDQALADQLKELPARVRFERIRRSIPPYQQLKIKKIDWKAIFPTKKSSARLAKELRCALSTVKRKRKLASVDWDSQPLGKMPDKDLAAKLKINYHHIRQERISRHIRPYGRIFDQLDWDTLLTGEPDAVIGERIGCSVHTVCSARLKLGRTNESIDRQRAYHIRISQIDWEAQGLGSRPDKVIAAELDVQPNIVSKQRNARLIPSAAVQLRQKLQQLLEQSDLGVESDTYIAEKLGTYRGRVAELRKAKGIDSLLGPNPNNSHKGIDWDKQPLGQMLDKNLAEILGVGLSAVSNQRYRRGIQAFKHTQAIDWDSQPLGQMADQTLAKQLDCEVGTVFNHRKARCIPSFKRQRSIDWENLPLGKMTDVELAEQLSCNSSSVRKQRYKRGIPTFTRSSK